MPVVAGETFSIKVGAKSASGRALAGSCRGHRLQRSGGGNRERSATRRGRKPRRCTGPRSTCPRRPEQFAEYAVRFIPDPREPATTRGDAFQHRGDGKARAQAHRQGHGARHGSSARRRRDPARPVSRPHQRGRPRRAACLQGRVSASALPHRPYRAPSRSISRATPASSSRWSMCPRTILTRAG